MTPILLRAECVITTKAKTTAGYGHWYKKGVHFYDHRFTYESYWGRALKKGEMVCHRCDNPSCVNVAHLFVGTAKDNSRDMWSKGRAKLPDMRGEEHHQAKLTDTKVRELRARYAEGENSAALAREIGMSHYAIWAACTGKTWRHL